MKLLIFLSFIIAGSYFAGKTCGYLKLKSWDASIGWGFALLFSCTTFYYIFQLLDCVE